MYFFIKITNLEQKPEEKCFSSRMAKVPNIFEADMTGVYNFIFANKGFNAAIAVQHLTF